MTARYGEQLVVDYLARLERAAAMLAPGDRADLIEGIREHIDTAQATGTVSDEAGMRTLLDRLGEPEARVALMAVASGMFILVTLALSVLAPMLAATYLALALRRR